ncbi:MAG: hypothetical protein CMJ94_10800 [Planctomycetes bacterium]|nr:hypothetical protein [Planctomycetota bacterium]
MSERKAFLLRMDPRLHDALKHWAEDELRSLNAQAEILLRDALRRAGRLPREDADESASEPAKPAPRPPDDQE